MAAPTMAAQSSATTTTQVIVLTFFLRCQSDRPKEFSGIYRASFDGTMFNFDFHRLRLATRDEVRFQSKPDCQAWPTDLADPASASPSLAKMSFHNRS
jgi:hypothetical protein